MIVVDASALVELLLGSRVGHTLADRLLAPAETLHAPHLVDLEVVHAIRRQALAGELTPARAAEVIHDLRLVPLHRYPHDALLPRIWELRGALTAYDASYAALAEALDATLVTCDGPLSRSTGHDAKIEFHARG